MELMLTSRAHYAVAATLSELVIMGIMKLKRFLAIHSSIISIPDAG